MKTAFLVKIIWAFQNNSFLFHKNLEPVCIKLSIFDGEAPRKQGNFSYSINERLL